jgi:hypothetical protein
MVPRGGMKDSIAGSLLRLDLSAQGSNPANTSRRYDRRLKDGR